MYFRPDLFIGAAQLVSVTECIAGSIWANIKLCFSNIVQVPGTSYEICVIRIMMSDTVIAEDT